MAPRFRTLASVLLLLISAAPALAPARAGVVSYSVSMDTSSIQGQTGFFTMDFLPTLGAQNAQALVTNFYSDGAFLVEPPLTEGDVMGDLSAGGVALGNSTPFNSQSQAMTFGSYLGFTLSITSDVIDNPDPSATGGTTFAAYVFERVPNPDTPPPAYVTGNPLVLTAGPGNAILTAELCDCGVVTVMPFAVVVPEPGTITLAALGGIVVLGRRLRPRRRAV